MADFSTVLYRFQKKSQYRQFSIFIVKLKVPLKMQVMLRKKIADPCFLGHLVYFATVMNGPWAYPTLLIPSYIY